MTYLIYTRVSARGSGWTGDTSCASQADECRRDVLSRDPGAVFLPVETDEFVTGTNNDRPALRRILDNIATAKWDVLVVLDMDRLARSQKGWIEIADLLHKHNKGLICVRQCADFSTIQGRMLLGIFSVIGEFFAKSNAQKTKDKMAWMARRGLWGPGTTPYGYRRPAAKNNALELDPATAPIVQAIFTRYLAGESTTALARSLNMHEDRITRILRNRAYLGRVVWGDVDAAGKHPALVTPEMFDAAQKRLPGTTKGPRPNRQTYDYLLSGIVRCQCGATMAASTANGATKRYPHYRCTNARCTVSPRTVRADRLDRAVLAHIADAAQSDRQIEENYQRLTEMITTMRKQASAPLAQLRAALAPLQERARNLSAAVQAGTLGPGALSAMANDLEGLYGQIRGLEDAIARHEADIDGQIAPESVRQLADAWRQLARDLVDSTDTAKRRDWIGYHLQDVTHQQRDAWRIRFWANPAAKKVRILGGDGYPGRWLCELLLTLPWKAA